MSDAQYDLTLALLTPPELAGWRSALERALTRARDAGEDLGQLTRRLDDVDVEYARRELELHAR